MSRVARRWGKHGFLRVEGASGLNSRGKDRLDPVGAEICFTSQVVSNHDELQGSLGWFELHGRVVSLFVSGDKAHVSRGNANESGHAIMSSNCIRDPL